MHYIKKGVLAGMILIALATLTGTTLAQEEGWEIERFSSILTIEENGVLDVRETIAVDFHGLEKHGIYRDLPVNYAQDDGSTWYSRVTVQNITMDGAPVPYETLRNTASVRIRIGDPDETISGKHVYAIQYTAEGVLLSFDAYDELYWNVTGNDWGVPIQKSSAEVHLATGEILQTDCYVGDYGSTASCDRTATSTEAATFTHESGLQSYEGLTIAVGFTKGAVPIIRIAAPKTAADLLRGSSRPYTAFLLTLIAGIVALIQSWRRWGKDLSRSWRSKVLVVEYDAPEKLRPAELGMIEKESATTLQVSATVVDLAVRGYIEITEIPKKGWFGKTDYELARKKAMDDTLREYERKVLRGLFENGETVKTSDLKLKFYKDLAEIKRELYEHAVQSGWFARNPNTSRGIHGVIGALLVLGGIAITVLGASIAFGETISAVLLGIGPALGIVGIVTIIVGVTAMPQRTEKGHALLQKIKGYREYITHAEKHRQQFFERENTFMEILPYAMVFGVTEKLASAMKEMGVTPQTPSWYHSQNAFNVAAFSSSLSSFERSLSSTMASAPSSSGSGGGGFSGGGGGGGGGGSW